MCEQIFVSPHVRHDRGSLKLLLENKLVGVTVFGTAFGVVASPIVHASHTPLLLRYELFQSMNDAKMIDQICIS